MASDGPPLRWRLILGQSAQAALGQNLQGEGAACDACLSWLYDRDPGLQQRGIRGQRQGGSENPSLSTVEWIEKIHELFPKETIERLERDAVEKYQIEEIVTNAEVIRKVQPSMSLLQAVMRTRHLMNQEVLALARQLVRRVVEELLEKLAREVQRSFGGPRRHSRSTPYKLSRELDAPTTLRANLRHWDPEERRLYVARPYFYQRNRRHRVPWQLVLLVDQSGSMLESVIHSAVTASCLWGVPSLKTHLVIFSTEVVDLTPEVTDPVETLMKFQLGGGTDITRAVQYSATLLENPGRSIVVVITDFFEGADPRQLVKEVRDLVAQGTIVLGLASLNPEAVPEYDRELAQRLVQVGAHVAAMTPGELARWIAEKVAM
ncbi:VWA domain-containing protein [bacterium]|nr:VWA domain-containing protein [bacterium]